MLRLSSSEGKEAVYLPVTAALTAQTQLSAGCSFADRAERRLTHRAIDALVAHAARQEPVLQHVQHLHTLCSRSCMRSGQAAASLPRTAGFSCKRLLQLYGTLSALPVSKLMTAQRATSSSDSVAPAARKIQLLQASAKCKPLRTRVNWE